ncbi:glycosyltransferase family protein [Hugenholtzia roseola]|uniref:glycosyltransferase family protein n=1 Tax=Hugenholtzia roseola TaxID=1002 RepID=UPI00041F0AA5|nr:glycosyltransferase family protein [Hugenholtzia roseola]
MRILYATQATGNGHIARACELIPILKKKGEVDILLSGTSSDLVLPYQVRYRAHGLSFAFGKKGGIDLFKTLQKAKLWRLWRDIQRLPLGQYDLIISDFEPISAWAARLRGKTCFALSNQAALFHPEVPKPDLERWRWAVQIGEWVLKNYAPTRERYGFHFLDLGEKIYPPLIRKGIRQAQIEEGEHYTVYLPAYSDEKVVKMCKHFPFEKWHIFSKTALTIRKIDNFSIFPIDLENFTESLRTSRGVIAGAGFETPAEALFLGKKLLVVPMKDQLEQHYNAAALKKMGVQVLKSLKKKHYGHIHYWLALEKGVHAPYPAMAEKLIDDLVREARQTRPSETPKSTWFWLSLLRKA